MEQLKLNLENCHGINKLNYCFDFNNPNYNDYLVYATNGTIKTSLNKTIEEYKNNEDTKDVFFPERNTKRYILDENNKPISPENLIVIGGNDYDIDSNKITSLLINNNLKKKYDAIFTNLNKIFLDISKKIKRKTGETIDTLLRDININEIINIQDYYLDSEQTIKEFKDIKYNKLFTEDNLKILKDDDVINLVNDYINICNDIITENNIFIKDVFELHNLKAVKKSLDSNNYFIPGHLLKLKNNFNNDYTDYTNSDIDELIDKINKKLEKDTRIAKVNQILTSKIKSQELNVFLSKNTWIIPYLKDLQTLKKEYWHYIISSDEIKYLIQEYSALFNKNKLEINKIIKQSNNKENLKKWNNAITIFNNKFINMPFKLRVENMSDIILKNSVCSLAYEFTDDTSTNSNVNLEVLKDNLSNGERKAFNILNLIFEIEYRKEKNIETFIIIDDIADSFDYKNKYAIIEFLKELNDDNLFHLIILTHNFDFYRSCANRLFVKTLSVQKNSSAIKLVDFFYKNNIFSTFKNRINEDKFFIASIPFIRNLIELGDNCNNIDYLKLTSTLHYKNDTANITTDNIKIIFSKILNKNCTITNQKYTDLLFAVADNFSIGNTDIELENKLVLSIAIRMLFEMKLFNKINDWNIVDSFAKNQTYEMIYYCKKHSLLSNREIELSEKVRIMTSENIHINAFMYEPIIDMTDDELILLYNEIKKM